MKKSLIILSLAVGAALFGSCFFMECLEPESHSGVHFANYEQFGIVAATYSHEPGVIEVDRDPQPVGDIESRLGEDGRFTGPELLYMKGQMHTGDFALGGCRYLLWVDAENRIVSEWDLFDTASMRWANVENWRMDSCTAIVCKEREQQQYLSTFSFEPDDIQRLSQD